MPPQGSQGGSWALYESDAGRDAGTSVVEVAPVAVKRKLQIVWRNVMLFALLHVGGVYGAYLFLAKAKWASCVFGKSVFSYF